MACLALHNENYNHCNSHCVSYTEIKCPPPPPLPPNYVCRQVLLEEMVLSLCHSSINPNNYGTSLTLTGAGGFGKTSIATALCHHPLIKEQFMDGCVFIELGPQATDPSMKLNQLYHLLSGQYLKQGDINHVEQEMYHLTHHYCHNLLVIIDDVWHVEDAVPIVKAFSNCKIVLTTRMNDIERYIPTKQVVTIGPMEKSEAISLLTCGVINVSKLSQVDMSLLDELAQDVYLWPLPLSLIRGQLANQLKLHRLSNHEAIQIVYTKLRDKGLMAFDKTNMERSRKYAVNFCIEMSLTLLTTSLLDNLKSLVLYTGLGNSLHITLLRNLWKTTEHEARDIVDTLWTYGLIQFTNISMPPHNKTQRCVEVHIVISQYIIEHMDGDEILNLSQYVQSGLGMTLIDHFFTSYGVDNPDTLSTPEFIKFVICEIEYHSLPIYLRMINSHAISDPHHTMRLLQWIQEIITELLPDITTFLPSIGERVDALITDCHNSLKNVHRLSRALNQSVQRCLTQRNYHNLIQTIESYMSNYCIALVAQKAVSTSEEIIPYCYDQQISDHVTFICNTLQMYTPEHHVITQMILPYIEVKTRQLRLIHTSLLTGSPDMDTIRNYLLSGLDAEENELLHIDPLITYQEMFPNGL